MRASILLFALCLTAGAAEPSLVRDWHMEGERRVTSWGTSFSIGDGLFLSALHIVQGGTLEIKSGDDWSRADVIAKDQALDLVLLKSAAKAEPYTVAATFNERGDLSIDGFPAGKRGTIAATFKEFRGSQVYLDARGFDHGHSGSPLLDDRALVVGVAVSGEKAGSDLDRKHAFAVSLPELRAFLRRAAPVKVPDEFTALPQLAPPTSKAEPVAAPATAPRSAKLLASFAVGQDWRAVRTPAGLVFERAEADALGDRAWRRAAAPYEDPEWARAAIAALAGRE